MRHHVRMASSDTRTPRGQQAFFDSTGAATEAIITPHAVADARGRNAMMCVAVERWYIHAPSMASCIGLNTLTTPMPAWIDWRMRVLEAISQFSVPLLLRRLDLSGAAWAGKGQTRAHGSGRIFWDRTCSASYA